MLIEMNTEENTNKKAKDIAKLKAENMTHGSRLLEREFRRQEAARKIVKQMNQREPKEK
jgi:hypothetical protein